MDRPTHLVVGVVKKPHGVKGEVLVYPVTDEPEAVFRTGRVLVVVDGEGRATGQELEVVRVRPFHRAWLLHFQGIEDREPVKAGPLDLPDYGAALGGPLGVDTAIEISQ